MSIDTLSCRRFFIGISKVNYKQLRYTSHYAALTRQPLSSFESSLISVKSCLS